MPRGSAPGRRRNAPPRIGRVRPDSRSSFSAATSCAPGERTFERASWRRQLKILTIASNSEDRPDRRTSVGGILNRDGRARPTPMGARYVSDRLDDRVQEADSAGDGRQAWEKERRHHEARHQLQGVRETVHSTAPPGRRVGFGREIDGPTASRPMRSQYLRRQHRRRSHPEASTPQRSSSVLTVAKPAAADQDSDESTRRGSTAEPTLFHALPASRPGHAGREASSGLAVAVRSSSSGLLGDGTCVCDARRRYDREDAPVHGCVPISSIVRPVAEDSTAASPRAGARTPPCRWGS